MNLPNLKDARARSNKKFSIIRDDYKIPNSIQEIGKGQGYLIFTYGCQMNVHDSENIGAILEDMGYFSVDDIEKASVVVLNTCAIRENAHNKVMGMLGRIKHLKESHNDIITIFCGCMAQEEGISHELQTKYPWVDIVMGTHNIHKLPLYIEEYYQSRKQQLEVFSIEGDVYEGIPVKRDSKYKAWVNIMYGCDKFCTYCIVPYTRGAQRSRKHEDIINEVKELVLSGYMEVTLLGQNVNAYGKDLYDNYKMADLLRDVALTGIPRVRFVTSHPWDFSTEMIQVISKYDNIMPYIHLPLQSGSNKILKKMGRRYTVEEYQKLFWKIKEMIPGCAITTDIIVGFPNESAEDFNSTMSLYRTLRFDLAYTFIYSPREGTPASKWKDSINEEIKKKRLAKLNELVNECAKENNLKYLNSIVPVLIEGKSDKKGKLMGYTDTMKLVNLEASEKYIGRIVDVKITAVKTWSLDGEIINDK